MNSWQKFRGHLSYHSIQLGVLALLAGGILAGANRLTAVEIAKRQSEDLNTSIAEVIPASIHDNDMVHDVITVPDGDGQTIKVYRARQGQQVSAVAYEFVAHGYSPTPIRLIMGIDKDGHILGVRVLSHAETPGLGDKIEAKKTHWILAFSGKSLDNPGAKGWHVKKDGGDFDQFSGATITPRGVVKGVYAALQFFAAHKPLLIHGQTPASANMTIQGGAP
jgi:H+/Na+-translocating ferredoxin:NAD+ oxidoreductase subunit G